MILYLTNLPIVLKSFPIYKITSANRDNWTSFFPIFFHLIFFSYLIVLVRTSIAALNNNGGCGYPCLVPDLNKNVSSIFQISMIGHTYKIPFSIYDNIRKDLRLKIFAEDNCFQHTHSHTHIHTFVKCISFHSTVFCALNLVLKLQQKQIGFKCLQLNLNFMRI